MVFCKRLQTDTPEQVCTSCIRDCGFRATLVAAAEEASIDWAELPCAYECAQGVTTEVSVANNHWKDASPAARPSLATRAANLAGAGARVVNAIIHNEDVVAPPEAKAHRLAICTTCSLHDPEAGTCGACGCIIKVKAGLAVEECPIGKWEKL